MVLFSILISSHDQDYSKIDSEIIKELEKNGEVEVIIRTKSESSYDNSLKLNSQNKENHYSLALSKEEFEKERDFSIISGFAGKIKNKKALFKLLNDPSIEHVSLNRIYRVFLSDSVPQINASLSHAIDYFGVNITGSGQAICVLDTGVNYEHESLGSCERTNDINDGSCDKVPGGHDFVNNDLDPYDDHGHGTHVSAIAAANGSLIGVAPDAKIIAMKVCDSSGGCATSDILSALEWCTDNKSLFNISVISMSFGQDGGSYTAATCPSYADEPGFAEAYAAGIFLVASSGNDGFTDGFTYPACNENVTAVGAVTKTDDMATYTSRGGDLPLLLAPGSSIVSARWDINSCLSGCLCSGQTMTCSGTSMAAPHVSAAAALMFQYTNLTGFSLNQSEIEKKLNSTGKPLYDTGSGKTYSRISSYESLMNITDYSPPVISDLSPFDIYNTSRYEIFFSVHVRENLNLTNVSLWHNFSSWSVNQTNTSGLLNSDYFFNNNFTEGTYLWSIEACDSSNVCTFSENRSFTIDLTPPMITLQNPVNNTANTTSNDIDFTLTVTDFLDISNCSLIINDEENLTLTNIPKNISFNMTTFLHIGTYNWTVNCTDMVNNSNATFVYNLTIVDQINPYVSLMSPKDLVEIFGDELIFYFNVTELYLDTCELWGNWTGIWHRNQTYQGFTQGSMQNFSNLNLSEGEYVWNIWCNDTSSNNAFSAQNYTIKVDKTKPLVESLHPVNYENSTRGDITFTYIVNDSNSISNCSLYINNTINGTNGSITKSVNQTFSIELFNGDYEWYISCTDNALNTNQSEVRYLTQSCSENWTCTSWSACVGNSQTRSCTDSNNCPAETNKPLESQSCGSSSTGGSGGGGGGSSYKISTTNKETVTFVTGGNAGETKTMSFQKDIVIASLDITLKNDINKISVTVEKLDKKPSETQAIDGDVYSYIKIDKSFNNEDISRAKIVFKVEKTWLLKKGFLPEEIRLKRYTSEWEKLPTRKTNQDSSYIYYEAESTGFSYFAIVGEKMKKPKLPVQKKIVKEKLENNSTQLVAAEKEVIAPPSKKNFFSKKFFFISFGIFIFVLALLILKRYKRKIHKQVKKIKKRHRKVKELKKRLKKKL